jgi:hypothetical protein
VLTIIESESSVWMVITVDGDLRLYARAEGGEGGEWGELSLSEDPEQVDPEKSFMLEELYAQSGQEEEDEEGQEPDEDGPELADDEGSDVSEDEEPEDEKKPRRRRAATAKSGVTTK